MNDFYLSRRLRRDVLTNGYTVSTVSLGRVYGDIYGEGRKVWETMVFGDGSWDEYQERYFSEVDAIKGHERILEEMKTRNCPNPKNPRRRFLSEDGAGCDAKVKSE